MELLRTEHLSKTYGTGDARVEALKDVSFTLPKGEFAAVVGESGSRKSTLLNYGRSFAYSLPASFDGQTAVINLVSYETYQFGWAESALLEGSLEAAERGNGVLVEYNASCPVSVGDIMEIETSDGTHQIPVAGLLSYTPFSKVEGEENVICSEALFQKFTGERRYTIIDIQLTRDASDQNVEELRAMTDSNMTFSDQRMSNNEVRGAYYSFSMFVYGFLAIIALIAVFNVVNGIAMSVSARMKEYGAMRAIGMSPGQLTRMIAAETAVYVGGGVFIGCAAGLPLNWLLEIIVFLSVMVLVILIPYFLTINLFPVIRVLALPTLFLFLVPDAI